MNITIERIYDFRKRKRHPGEYAVLVDRLWPRGVVKESIEFDEWLKQLTPSNELRKWFNHEPEKLEQFTLKYRKELDEQGDELKRLAEISEKKKLVLLYAAKDPKVNHAIALKKIIADSLG
ncbi:MAG: DUF488 family protein [Victivallaceae bacterium]